MNNPLSNSLGAGVTTEMVEEAVRKSGYPLQTEVAKSLKPLFSVCEEWSFRDEKSGELRALDIVASRPLYEFEAQPRVRPHLSLLIECKQSDLPYVFFLASDRTVLQEFPALAGLATNKVTAITDDDPSSYTCSTQCALGLNADPFLTHSPRHCMSFTKAVRKGKYLELSGADCFNGIVLPLVKATRDYLKQNEPPKTAVYFDMHATLAVAVVDAPMMTVDVTSEGNQLSHEPWVRVIRHQTREATHKFERSQTYAIDVVHKDFLPIYLNDHILPFSERFAESAQKHPTEIITGKAFAPRLGRRGFSGFEEMSPRKSTSAIQHLGILAKSAAKLVFR